MIERPPEITTESLLAWLLACGWTSVAIGWRRWAWRHAGAIQAGLVREGVRCKTFSESEPFNQDLYEILVLLNCCNPMCYNELREHSCVRLIPRIHLRAFEPGIVRRR